jgi:hypothetical protein
MVLQVTDTDIQAFLSAVSNQDFGKVTVEDFDVFMYQGFDPEGVISHFVKKQKESNIPDETRNRDMAFICGIAILTGAPTEEQLKKRMSEQGQQQVKQLALKWDIHWGGGRGKGKNHVTFPRTALAFIIVTLKIMEKIGAKDFPNDMLSSRLPKMMKHPGFPSVIPQSLGEDARRALLNASLCYGIDMSISLQQIEKPDPKVIASKQKPFLRSSHVSKLPSETDRRVFFKTLNLQDEYKKISQVLETYRLKVDPDYIIPGEVAYKASFATL